MYVSPVDNVLWRSALPGISARNFCPEFLSGINSLFTVLDRVEHLTPLDLYK
jgi:hypothetical protein